MGCERHRNSSPFVQSKVKGIRIVLLSFVVIKTSFSLFQPGISVSPCWSSLSLMIWPPQDNLTVHLGRKGMKARTRAQKHTSEPWRFFFMGTSPDEEGNLQTIKKPVLWWNRKRKTFAPGCSLLPVKLSSHPREKRSLPQRTSSYYRLHTFAHEITY